MDADRDVLGAAVASAPAKVARAIAFSSEPEAIRYPSTFAEGTGREEVHRENI